MGVLGGGNVPTRSFQREGHSLVGGVEGRALAGFQGSALNPSEEPTTTEAKPVVIVGYNRKPFFFSGDWLRTPLADWNCLFFSTSFCKCSFKSLHPP